MTDDGSSFPGYGNNYNGVIKLIELILALRILYDVLRILHDVLRIVYDVLRNAYFF